MKKENFYLFMQSVPKAALHIHIEAVITLESICRLYEKRFPNRPVVIVHAPVCRSGWLVEMECMAVKAQTDKRFPAF